MNTGNKSCTRPGSSPVALKISLGFSSVYFTILFCHISARNSSHSFEKTPTIYTSKRAARSGEGCYDFWCWNSYFSQLFPKQNRHNPPLEMNGNFFLNTKFHLFSKSTSSLILAHRNVIQTLKWRKTCALFTTLNCFYITCKLLKVWAINRGVEITFSSKLEWKY